MKLRILSMAVGALAFTFVLNLNTNAQFDNRIGQTWSNQTTSVSGSLIDRLAQMQKGKSAKSSPRNLSAVKFAPAGDSGVPQALADALGQNAEQKTALTEAFLQIKEAYENEVAEDGKSNNLAAAFTFFIAANVTAYYQSDASSEQGTENLFNSLQEVIAGVPAFAEMSDSEKQKMHDWLVCMGGLAMTNYMDARQNNDAQSLANIKSFADYSIRLVLGIETKNLSFSSAGLNVQNDSSNLNTATTTQFISNAIVGTWSKASSSSVGTAGTMDGTLKQVSSAGTYRARYMFNSEGTYNFKSEMSPSSQIWWTTEETGSFSVSGDILTVSPKTSKATFRNLDGVVQKTQDKPLENTIYKWKTHYFSGIGETNLVLEPSQPTSRDGTIGGNSLFPNAYLYGQGDRLAWRF